MCRRNPHRAQRKVPAAQALRLHDDVGERLSPMMRRDERSRATGAAKHFIEHEKNPMSRADLTHGAEISRRRHDRSSREAADRFENEREHVLAAELGDLRIEGAGAGG